MGAATFEAYERDRQNAIKAKAAEEDEDKKAAVKKSRKARSARRVKPDVIGNYDK
jgi:hypothetical protein